MTGGCGFEKDYSGEGVSLGERTTVGGRRSCGGRTAVGRDERLRW